MAVDDVAQGLAVKGLQLAKEALEKATHFSQGIVWIGDVDYYDDLPDDPNVGDAYTVKYLGTSGTTPNGTMYAWGLNQTTGEAKWISIGPDVKGIMEQIQTIEQTLDLKAPKPVTIPVSTGGFDTNLRQNQSVDGSVLVDRIIEVASTGAKVNLKAGEYYFNITSWLVSEIEGVEVKAFTCDSASLTDSDIQKVVTGQDPLSAKPFDETGIFLYSSATDKTVYLYTSDITERVTEINDTNRNSENLVTTVNAVYDALPKVVDLL